MAGIPGMGQPNDIKNPVPSEELNNALTFDLPKALADTNPVDEIDYDALVNQAFSDEIDYDALVDDAFSEEPIITDGEDVEDPTDVRGNEGLMGETAVQSIVQQLEQAPTRLKASFATTDKEKMQVLEKAYGIGNVKKIKDGFKYKKDGKWRTFDSDNFEVIGDVLDFGRDVVEEVGATVGTGLGLGAAAGVSAGTGGTGLVASPGIVAGARAAGSAGGVSLADMIAEEMLGIKRDEGRSRSLELGLAGVTSGALGFVGDWISKKLSARAVKNINSIERFDDVMKTGMDDLQQAVDGLKERGLVSSVPTAYGSVDALPEQINIKNPEILKKAKILYKDPEYQRVSNKLGEMANDLAKNINKEISQVIPKTGAGTDFLNYASNIQEAEGALIGKFRKTAIEEAGDGVIPMKNSVEAVTELFQQLGYAPGKTVSGGDITTRKLMTQMEDMYKKLSEDGGKIEMRDLDEMYNKISKLAKPYWKDTSDATGEPFRKLWSAVRDDYTNAINVLLDEGKVKSISKASYQDSLNKFTQIKNYSQELSGILKKNEITSESLGRFLFNDKTAALDNIKNVKGLIELSGDTGLWNDIRRAHLDDLMKDSYNPKTEIYDLAKYTNQILKKDPKIVEQLVGDKEAVNLLKYAGTYGNRIQNYSAKNFLEDQTAKEIAGIFTVLGTKAARVPEAAWELLAHAGKNKSLADYLSKDGQTKVLALVPTNKQGAVRSAIEKVINYASLSDTADLKAINALARMKARELSTGASRPEEGE